MSTKFPGVGTPYTNQGGKEASIGDRGVAIPMTINGAAARYGTSTVDEVITGPHLYARETVSPYKALPFFSNGAMTDITNSTNFICDVPDSVAKRFAVGDFVKFYDVSATALDAGTLTNLTIDVVSAAGGGTGGAGFTKITCTGEVFTNTPATADLLVLADGTELSANVVVVEGDITFDGVTDFSAPGYVSGVFNKSEVNNTDYYVAADNQNLELIDIQ